MFSFPQGPFWSYLETYYTLFIKKDNFSKFRHLQNYFYYYFVVEFKFLMHFQWISGSELSVPNLEISGKWFDFLWNLGTHWLSFSKVSYFWCSVMSDQIQPARELYSWVTIPILFVIVNTCQRNSNQTGKRLYIRKRNARHNFVHSLIPPWHAPTIPKSLNWKWSSSDRF